MINNSLKMPNIVRFTKLLLSLGGIALYLAICLIFGIAEYLSD